jgi:phosphatidylglycerophosphate synthase
MAMSLPHDLTVHPSDYLCGMTQLPPDTFSAVPITTRASAARSGLAMATAVTLGAMVLVNLTLFAAGKLALASMGVVLLGVLLLWDKLPRHYPHARFGACNTVTLLRAGLGATLLTPLLLLGGGMDTAQGWTIVLIATLALSLDGVDGWFARRDGLTSSFGARFDMEVDAALAFILSLLALVNSTVGPVVLVLGLMRYAFVAASWALPWLAAPLPEKTGRKVVCVIQIAALIVLQAPIITGHLALTIASGAAVALIWSFGRDILWLWRHRS